MADLNVMRGKREMRPQSFRIAENALRSPIAKQSNSNAVPTLRHIDIIDVRVGKNVIVVEPVNLYGCTIDDDSFVGPFVEIQKGATIGKRCRIQSHVFICDLVTIGDDCFISHGAMFINDLFSGGGPAGKPELWRATKLGNRVSVGTNATILPVTICDHVVIGAGAVVTKDIAVPGIYAGNPARLLRR